MSTGSALFLGSLLIATGARPSLTAADAASPVGTAMTIAGDTRTAERQLIGDSLLNGQAYEYDRQLADSIGPRLTGSANFQKAAGWAEQQFKALGLSNVHTEEWTLPATWEPDIAAAGHILAPVDHILHIVSLGRSPSTPPGGVTGKIVYVKDLTAAKLDEQKSELTGAIVLFDHASLGEKPKLDVIFSALEHLASLRPLAILSTGVASVIETARAMKGLNRPTRRTVRFALFGGEEQGLLSAAYVRQHAADLDKIDAVLVTDSGSEAAKGWMLMGREDEKSAVEALKPLLSGLGADEISSDTTYAFQTDHAPFEFLGVPELLLWTGMDKYDTLHHKASDTLDSVVQKDLAQGAAVMAVTAYAIADSPQPFASHLSPAEVRSMAEKSDNLSAYDYFKKIGALP
jgi:hypothetical protein